MSTGPSARTKGAKKRSVYKSHHDPPGIFSTSRHARRRRVRPFDRSTVRPFDRSTVRPFVRPFDPSFDRPIARSIDRSIDGCKVERRPRRARARDGWIHVPNRRPPSSSPVVVVDRRRASTDAPAPTGSGRIGSDRVGSGPPARPAIRARLFHVSRPTDRDRPRPTATGS